MADLIELCFESTMDDDGQSYVQQMRRASTDQDFLSWAGRVMESTSMPLAGYVWEEDGKIIGNVSLVFQVHQGRKLAMIANVATHPNYRRHGIGRALTERAMLGARQKGAREIWLQVRHDNPTAIRIYSGPGIRGARPPHDIPLAERPRMRRQPAEPDAESLDSAAHAQIASSHEPTPRHWHEQHEWLRASTSRGDQLVRPLGLESSWARACRMRCTGFVVQYDMRQWAAAARARPAGAGDLGADATGSPTHFGSRRHRTAAPAVTQGAGGGAPRAGALPKADRGVPGRRVAARDRGCGFRGIPDAALDACNPRRSMLV